MVSVGLSAPLRLAWPKSATVLLAFVVGLAIAAYGLYRQSGAAPTSTDFEVFWRAARHASDPLLYDAAHLNAGQTFRGGGVPAPFAYPPTFLLLAFPFGLLPYAVSYLLWVGLSCAAFTAAASRLVKPGWAALVLPLSLPVMVTAAYGQSTLFAAAALVWGVSLAEEATVSAGVLFAIAACIKPQLMLLSPVLLIGHWRATAAFALCGLGLVLASCVFGADHWLEWPRAVLQFNQTVNRLPLAFANPSRLVDDPLARVLVAGFGIAFAVWSARGDAGSRIVGVVAGSLCCTPYAARNDIAMLAPAALFWLLQPGTMSGWIRRAAGATTLLGLVAGPLALLAFMATKLVADGVELWRGVPHSRRQPTIGFGGDFPAGVRAKRPGRPLTVAQRVAATDGPHVQSRRKKAA